MNSKLAITLREAAFIFGMKLKDIVRVIDEHPELTPKTTHGNRTLRILGIPELLYLQALHETGELLTPQGRRMLHEALVNSGNGPAVAVGQFVLPLVPLQSKVERRLEALNQLKNSVEGNPEDPYIKGTNVEVYRISALFGGGATIEQVAEDYPSLTKEQIKTARKYAAVIPKMGRPYSKMSFKRAARLLNLDELDELLEQS